MVFYRKYRPQTLDDLIGQDAVKINLKNAFLNQKISHAYLFVGPRGTGKTSTARILAKMVNCLEKEPIPCGKCASCLSVQDGSALDLIEIDAASNRGIEDIRSLRENIKLSPSNFTKKVYIIDEVHMLTLEAFNALLKTLEEPPSHVLFILATTDLQKVPATILSRVTKLEFKLASVEQLIDSFKKILQKEKVESDDEGLALIARHAQGSFRDGVKLLDQVASSGKITKQEVEKILSSTSLEKVVNILEYVAERRPKEALESFSEVIENGAAIKELNLSILEILKDLVLVKYDLTKSLLSGRYLEDDLRKIHELAKKFDLSRLTASLDVFCKALEKSKYVLIPTLPLEIAIVESCLENHHSTDPANKQPHPTSSPHTTSQQAVDDPPSTDLPKTNNRPTDNQSSDDILKIQEKWNYILETTRAYNYSLEALLRSAKVTQCDKRVVTIEVPYSFHQRMLEAPKSRDMLESILSDILGRSMVVATILGKRPAQREDIANVELAPDDEIVRLAAEIFSSDSVN